MMIGSDGLQECAKFGRIGVVDHRSATSISVADHLAEHRRNMLNTMGGHHKLLIGDSDRKRVGGTQRREAKT